MIKKTLLITAVVAASVSVAACGKKAETAPTTEAVTEAVTEATSEETTEAEIEEDYMSGIIVKIDGNILTVNDISEETEKNYDISNAEIIKEFDLSEGDWVDITFPEETTEDPIPVIVLEVTDSVIGANTDPSVEGTVIDATMNTLTLEIDGNQHTFGTPNAYIVAEDGIVTGSTVTVTFIGDLDDAADAVKIVAEDSYGTDEAKVNAFIADVAQIGENGDSIVMLAGNGDFFTFTSDDIDFSDYSVGETLQIEYEGSITEKEIPALKITKK